MLLDAPAALPLGAPVEPAVAPVEPEVAPVEPAAPDVAPVEPVAPDVAPVEPAAPAEPLVLLRSIDALALARPVTWTRCPTWLARSEVLPLRRQVAAPEVAPADALTPADPLAAVLPADPAPDGVDAPAEPVAPVDPLAPAGAPLEAVADPVVPVAPAELLPELPLALADADGAALDMTLVNV